MIKKTYPIELDIRTPSPIPPIEVVENDTQNVFVIHLKDGASNVNIQGLNAIVAFTSKLGTLLMDYNNGVRITDAANGEITVSLQSSAFCAGQVLCQVSLVDSYGYTATSTRFHFNCTAPLLNNNAVAAQPNVGILQNLLIEFNNALLTTEQFRVKIDITEQVNAQVFPGAKEYIDRVNTTCCLRVYDGEFYYFLDSFEVCDVIFQRVWSNEDGITGQRMRRGLNCTETGEIQWESWSSFIPTTGGKAHGPLYARTLAAGQSYQNGEFVPKSYVDAAIAAALSNS